MNESRQYGSFIGAGSEKFDTLPKKTCSALTSSDNLSPSPMGMGCSVWGAETEIGIFQLTGVTDILWMIPMKESRMV